MWSGFRQCCFELIRCSVTPHLPFFFWLYVCATSCCTCDCNFYFLTIMYSNRDALQTNASISPQDHLLTAMSEIWIWVSSYTMSITKASGIYFCQRPLQRPENDDVIILTPQFRTEWPVWAQMCDLNQLGCVTVASIIKIRVAFVFQPCSQYLLAQNNLIMQYVTWPQASAVGSLSNFHTTLLLK